MFADLLVIILIISTNLISTPKCVLFIFVILSKIIIYPVQVHFGFETSGFLFIIIPSIYLLVTEYINSFNNVNKKDHSLSRIRDQMALTR